MRVVLSANFEFDGWRTGGAAVGVPGKLQLGELVLKQGGDYGVEGRAEVHKRDPGVGCWGVQVL